MFFCISISHRSFCFSFKVEEIQTYKYLDRNNSNTVYRLLSCRNTATNMEFFLLLKILIVSERRVHIKEILE